MSTSSNFLETDGDHLHTSSRKSLEATSSQHITELSRSIGEESSSSIDREEVLELEIKQLRRQNDFLKKKIGELTEELKSNKPERRKSSRKGVQREEKQQLHLTVEFFYQQIATLLRSVTELFHVELSPSQKNLFEEGMTYEDQLNPTKKYHIVKRYTLNRRLQKIMLESEEEKYPQLLDVFSNFYKSKQECDEYVKGVVDSLSKRALDLNKMVVDRAHKKNLRRSDARSQYTLENTGTEKTLLTQTPHSSTFNLIPSSRKLIQNKLLSDLDDYDRERISRGLQRIM